MARSNSTATEKKVKAKLLEIFRAGLDAVDPCVAVERWLRSANSVALDRYNRIIVIGAGKAAAGMAFGAECVLGDRIVDGLVIVKDGHGGSLPRICQREASHPVPDERGQTATYEMLELLRKADEKTLVLCLLSGGGSALLVAPAFGLTLADKQTVTEMLLRSGAGIRELNVVRKHLSAVKGGGLSRAAGSATMVTLIVSDDLGDRLDVIASGPTVADSSTYRDALSVIGKYSLRDMIPERVRTHLAKGVSGFVPETMKKGDRCLENKRVVIIAGLGQAVDAVQAKAGEFGYSTRNLGANLYGEAKDAAAVLAELALKTQKGLKTGETLCLISGGKTTVTVKGTGKGGRNQELALAFAQAVAGNKGITMVAAGTDGTDGPTDAAGAIVDGNTAIDAGSHGLIAAEYLARNDSYTFFQEYDLHSGAQAHIKTGPTGTNVMDIQIILVEK